jgi:membrane protein
VNFIRRATAVIRRTLLNLERKHLQLAAAGLAYYFLISLIPGLLLVTAVVTYLPVQNGQEVATSFLGHVIPQQAVPLIGQLWGSLSSHRSGLLSVGIISTLWLVSKSVKAVIAGLDMVYQVQRPRRVWTNRILAFGLTFGVGVLLLLAVMLTLAGPFLSSLFSKILPVQSLWIRIWPYVQWSLAALFTFAAVELLYILAPNVPLTRRITVPGAVVAALIWMALSWGVGFFFNQFGSSKIDRFYGVMATPITLAVWLYWGALGMLAGAEFNLSLQSLRSPPKDVLEQQEQSRAA